MAIQLIRLGHTVIIPHTMYFAVEIIEPNIPYERYLEMDLEILECCDAIFMLDNWQDSQGAKIEYEMAQNQQKIIYFSLNDVPDNRR